MNSILINIFEKDGFYFVSSQKVTSQISSSEVNRITDELERLVDQLQEVAFEAVMKEGQKTEFIKH